MGNRVLVKILEAENSTPSGILLPETAKEKPQEGLIEAVGNEEEMFSDLQVGDRVLFAKYTGTEIAYNGEDYLILSEEDILARLKEG